MCLICRRRRAQVELLRVGYGPDSTLRVFPESGRRVRGAVGRSAYVCPDVHEIAALFERGRLARALRRAVHPAESERLRQDLLCKLR